MTIRSTVATAALAVVALSHNAALAQTDCYKATVLAGGPTAYWRLGESAGATAVDETGARPGTYVGVTLGQTGPALLGANKAGLFDPSSRVDVATGPIVSDAPASTVEAWFRADSLPAGIMEIYSEDVGTGTIFGLRVNAGKLQYGIYTGSAWRFATGTTTIVAGRWYYAAAVLGTTGQTLYLWDSTVGGDLLVEATNPTTGPSDSAALSAEIGCGRFSGGDTFEHFLGTIDEVALHRTALTRADLQIRTVQRSPRMTAQPTGDTFCIGARVELSVAAAGDTPFTYQWRRGGDAIEAATSATYAFDAGPLNGGSYDCLVTNACGSTTSNPASVVVCVADFDCSGGTPDANDIVAFFEIWLTGDPRADVDGSGFTPDTNDISAFFDAWNAGC